MGRLPAVRLGRSDDDSHRGPQFSGQFLVVVRRHFVETQRLFGLSPGLFLFAKRSQRRGQFGASFGVVGIKLDSLLVMSCGSLQIVLATIVLKGFQAPVAGLFACGGPVGTPSSRLVHGLFPALESRAIVLPPPAQEFDAREVAPRLLPLRIGSRGRLERLFLPRQTFGTRLGLQKPQSGVHHREIVAPDEGAENQK